MCFSQNGRRYIYTTNTVERFIKEVKRRTKVIEVFPQEVSAEKIVYLVSIDMNDKYASRRLRGFQDASDALIRMKEERHGKKREKDKEREKKLNKTPKTTDKIEVSIL